ncbi:MAG: hypothetical protein M5T61_02845 [Acidimicrobiia bacterium]|nr:hypothetical protein [Acidimicrobiia bacterium]
MEDAETVDNGETLDDSYLIEIERELCRLDEVSIARIVADSVGRITEVHILANPGKHPKQIVRDIQSIALASFGVEIDRRVVSVVQLGRDGDPLPTDQLFRPTIGGITAESSGLRSLVRVTLSHDGAEVVGFAEGSVASTARHRLVATATVDALRQIEPSAACLDAEHAEVVRAGGRDVAVVTMVFVVPPHEQVVSGSAIVRAHQEADAVARAVLDATNRRLARVSIRS